MEDGKKSMSDNCPTSMYSIRAVHLHIMYQSGEDQRKWKQRVRGNTKGVVMQVGSQIFAILGIELIKVNVGSHNSFDKLVDAHADVTGVVWLSENTTRQMLDTEVFDGAKDCTLP